MSLYYSLLDSGIVVSGKTYPYRDRMRALGAQYNAVDKSWIVPRSEANQVLIDELCRSIGGGPLKASNTEKIETSLRTQEPQPTLEVESSSRLPSSLSSFRMPSLAELPSEGLELPSGLSIAELMQKAQLAIAQNFPRSLWVIGEIQNIRFHPSGVYFQLADSKEGKSQSATLTVNATLWKSNHRELERKFGDSLKEILQDGFRVRVLADLTLFKDRGQLSLQVQSIDPNFTKGSLALQREKLLKELKQKGLHLKNKSLKLSAFPLKIGLLSAEDSRAKSDFLDQLKVYGFPGEVIFRPCQMQGEATLKDVVSGLKFFSDAKVDLIVMTRGGGSAADLRWFDSSEIAYAIAETPIPIVAAIGHHEDTCVAEEICFHREKTPTAAADFIISHLQKTRERLDQMLLFLDKTLNERVTLFETYLMGLMEKMRSFAQSQLADQRRLVDQAEAAVDLNWQRRLLHFGGRLDQLQNFLGRGLDSRLARETVKQQDLRSALKPALDMRLAQETSRLDKAASYFYSRSGTVIERQESILREGMRDLKRGCSDHLRELEHALQKAEAFLKQKDPKPWLEAGWTQLFDEEGLVKSSERLKEGQELKARITDSLLTLTLQNIDKPK